MGKKQSPCKKTPNNSKAPTKQTLQKRKNVIKQLNFLYSAIVYAVKNDCTIVLTSQKRPNIVEDSLPRYPILQIIHGKKEIFSSEKCYEVIDKELVFLENTFTPVIGTIPQFDIKKKKTEFNMKIVNNIFLQMLLLKKDISDEDKKGGRKTSEFTNRVNVKSVTSIKSLLDEFGDKGNRISGEKEVENYFPK